MEKTYYAAYCQLCVNTASADMDTATRLEDTQGPGHRGPQQSLGGRGGTTPGAPHRTFSRGPGPAASTARANSGGVNTQEPYRFPLLTYPSLTTVRLGAP